jgi:AraC-like DNA-binding protein
VLPGSVYFSYSVRGWRNVPEPGVAERPASSEVIGSLALAENCEQFKTEDPRVDRAISILNEEFTSSAVPGEAEPSTRRLCEDHLVRMLKQETGVCFSEHLRQLRIKKVKDLLLNSNDEIKTIAAAAGYGSHSYFARHFRQAESKKCLVYYSECRICATDFTLICCFSRLHSLTDCRRRK